MKAIQFLVLAMVATVASASGPQSKVYRGIYAWTYESEVLIPEGSDECWSISGDMTKAEVRSDMGSGKIVLRGVLGPVESIESLDRCTRTIKVEQVLEFELISERNLPN